MAQSFLLGPDCFPLRKYDSPRFGSAARSVFSVATCTGPRSVDLEADRELEKIDYRQEENRRCATPMMGKVEGETEENGLRRDVRNVQRRRARPSTTSPSLEWPGTLDAG